MQRLNRLNVFGEQGAEEALQHVVSLAQELVKIANGLLVDTKV